MSRTSRDGRVCPQADMSRVEIPQCSGVVCAIVWQATQEGLAPLKFTACGAVAWLLAKLAQQWAAQR
jgi:hypothetical protein